MVIPKKVGMAISILFNMYFRNRYVLIADSAYQLFRDNRFFFEVATYYVADCAEGLSANAYVYLGD